MPRFDRHNEIELNLLPSGRLTYLMGGRRVVVPSRRLAVFWAGIPHQILDFDGASDYFVATVPLAWALQWALPSRLTQALLGGTVVIEPDGDRFSMDLQRFETWCDDAQNGSGKRVRASLLEMEARLERLALSAVGESEPHTTSKPPVAIDQDRLGRAERMACFVAQNYTQTLTSGRIAEHVSLHTNYAMALFRQTFGVTLARYVVQHRLSHAQRLLVTTDDLIENVAYASGFGSLSRFNEAFKEAFGCAPKEFRRTHRSEPSAEG